MHFCIQKFNEFKTRVIDSIFFRVGNLVANELYVLLNLRKWVKTDKIKSVWEPGEIYVEVRLVGLSSAQPGDSGECIRCSFNNNLTLLRSLSLSLWQPGRFKLPTSQPSALISSFHVILEEFLSVDVKFLERDF